MSSKPSDPVESDLTPLRNELAAWAGKSDDELDLAAIALQFSGWQRGQPSPERYRHFLTRLAEKVSDSHQRYPEEDKSKATSLALKHRALVDAIVRQESFEGDSRTYDDLDNADLCRVIDRRKGLPVALAIIYMHCARAQGWQAHGLQFPGHFLIRIEDESGRMILDPFAEGKDMQAGDLRALIKTIFGPQGELSADYYEPAENRDVILRLQNNIKTRQIISEDYQGALHTVTGMRAFAPDEYRLLLDAGVLNARLNRPKDAVEALEQYIHKAPSTKDREEAAMLLQDMRRFLN